MIGQLTAVNLQRRDIKVQVGEEEVLYKLADFIKIDYLPELGTEVSFSLDKENHDTITFIKANFPSGSSNGFRKTFPPKQFPQKSFSGNFANNQKFQEDRQDIISSQWAINAALKLMELNRSELKGVVTIDAVVELAKQFKEQSKW
jgi:hypothetical protein